MVEEKKVVALFATFKKADQKLVYEMLFGRVSEYNEIGVFGWCISDPGTWTREECIEVFNANKEFLIDLHIINVDFAPGEYEGHITGFSCKSLAVEVVMVL